MLSRESARVCEVLCQHSKHLAKAKEPQTSFGVRTIKLDVAQEWTFKEIIVAILLFDGIDRVFVQLLETSSDNGRPIRGLIDRFSAFR